MKHIVMFSGGVGSWATAKRVAAQHGTRDLILVFADTKMEDADLYRFLYEGADNIGGELLILTEGRNPWQVFNDVRYLGNTRIDPCSRILKRDLIRKWLETHHTPDNALIYLGYDWTEAHRPAKAARFWEPWLVASPMIDPPLLSKDDMIEWLEAEGIKRPRLYRLGFPHNNCGGFCIKAGQAHFKHLLTTLPKRYAFHERKEELLRKRLGKDVAILRDRTGGTTKPLTLRDFRHRVLYGGYCDEGDWGGCGCFDQTD